MKSIIKIHLCVLLLTIVSNGVGGNRLKEISKYLENMAQENENKNEKANIGGVFEPSKNGLLALNAFSVSHKGLLTKKGITKEVTMKFTIKKTNSDHELAIYKHLHTIGGDTTYGVPAIHHLGIWEDCTMMAMTLFDRGYQQTICDNRLTEADFLILFREILRITKYIHGNDVYHGHIHLRHIMFRGEAGFIYDFSVAAVFPGGKDTDGQSAARGDLKQLLQGMYLYLKRASRLSWLGFSENDAHQTKSMSSFLSTLRNDSRSNDQFIGLRRAFVEFAKSALSDDSTPITESFYDQPLQAIVEEIERYAQQQGKQVVPSWLAEDQDSVQPGSSLSGGSEERNPEKAPYGPSCRRKR